MKILDKYIIKQFLLTTIFGLIAFIFIFIIIDLMEKLDNFIDNSANMEIVIKYYISFTPEIIRLMIPVSILLSALFTVGKMSNQSETTVIKASGISFLRFSQPFLLATIVISIFALIFGGYIVPKANKSRIAIEKQFLNMSQSRSNANIFFQDSPTRIVTMRFYDSESKIIHFVSIQEFSKQNIARLSYRFDARKMIYDSTKSTWVLLNGVFRAFRVGTDTSFAFNEYKIKKFNFNLDDILRKQRRPEEMNLTELREEADLTISSGNDPTRLLIEYYSRFAFAFAGIITLLFGLPLSVNKRNSGVALQVGINLLITFTYLVLMQISQAFGKNGDLNPFITAWLANFVFLFLAIINIYRAQKS